MLVAAVPLPAIRDPMVASSPVEVIVGEENITGHDGWSDPEVVGTPSVVAMVGRNALPMSKDTTLSSVDECTEWDIRDQFETINGMSVYYGGDLCDLDESDWDDPYDIASAEYVEQYNFDVPEGMELMVHVRRRGPYGSDIWENEETGLTHVSQTSLGCTRDELDTVDVDSLAEIFAEELLVTDGFYQGTVSSVAGDFSDPDDGSVEDNEYLGGLVWFCILDCIWRFGSWPMVAFSDRLFSEGGVSRYGCYGQYVIRRFILEMGMRPCHIVNRFACCIPPVRDV